ncbi:MAG TPA: S8 family serine peptidase [Gaiellaceae bacterium]
MAAATTAVLVAGDGLADPLRGPQTEVVVTLKAQALAQFGRSLQAASHATYEKELLAAQAATVTRVEATVPGATVRWRYHLVLDGFAVALPQSSVAALAHVPGVARVWPNVVYHSLRTQDGVSQIGADQIWGPTLATSGQGMKIGFIDDGIDAQHPYFDPAGFAYPPGFPKGRVALATPKVIVQRAFAPANATWKYANAPFDPINSFHATHVAGIAAGDHGTRDGSRALSGVAPGAWIGNYKALGTPTPGFGLDGNSAEIAAAIEAAVSDGMNVINLSIGEPEVEPSRDLVVVALDNAARAGVVPVVAAGNDHDLLGDGTVTSPANAPAAISVAAVDSTDHIASFSSAGPTAVSLEMKPDVSAPGVNVVSSVPPSQGTWTTLSGTSMATPHVAGAAALLLQRHPSWTVADVKSALVQTGVPVLGDNGAEVATTREGGGLINLPRADNPLLFAAPTGLSFGELAPGATAGQTVTLADAGGGAGTWAVSTVVQGGAGSVSAPASVTVPGTLALSATAGATTGDVTGFVVLTFGAQTRHIPFWFDVSAPKLAHEKHTSLAKPGVYKTTTKGGASLVSTYRYPTGDRSYPGPERVYRVTITKSVANFGVVVLTGSATPHVTFDGDEDHLTGYAGLPLDLNPYRTQYGTRIRVAGAVLPARGPYDIVFDTASAAAAGPFSFRYWVNDVTPPKLKLLPSKGKLIRVSATDGGSGVDPSSIVAKVDGTLVRGVWRSGIFSVTASPGRHKLAISVADYEETKNMEDVPPILPNTATLTATVRVS